MLLTFTAIKCAWTLAFYYNLVCKIFETRGEKRVLGFHAHFQVIEAHAV